MSISRCLSCQCSGVAPEKALPTVLWPPKWGCTCLDDVKINGAFPSLCTLEDSLTVGKQQCTVVQTSTFAGCIHSISFSPASSRIAIAFGYEIALTDVIPKPYRLKDSRECLPKPPASPYGDNKPGRPLTNSIQFMRKKNYLVATYTAHGIVYVPIEYLRTALIAQ